MTSQWCSRSRLHVFSAKTKLAVDAEVHKKIHSISRLVTQVESLKCLRAGPRITQPSHLARAKSSNDCLANDCLDVSRSRSIISVRNEHHCAGQPHIPQLLLFHFLELESTPALDLVCAKPVRQALPRLVSPK